MTESTSARNSLRRAVAVVALVAVTTGCGPARSTQAFCDTYHEERRAFVAKYEARQAEVQASDDAFLGALLALAAGLEAFGDMAVMFDKLARVAPDDIVADVEAVRDQLKRQQDSAGDVVSNPLGTLAGGLLSGLMTAGSYSRVERYIETHCY